MTHAFAGLRRVGAWTMLYCLLAVGLVTSAQPTEAQSAQQKKPNIVFILVDNFGWGNFGVYGGTIPTPRIDKLASEGIRFNNTVGLARLRPMAGIEQRRQVLGSRDACSREQGSILLRARYRLAVYVHSPDEESDSLFQVLRRVFG
jgi:Sulfatase